MRELAHALNSRIAAAQQQQQAFCATTSFSFSSIALHLTKPQKHQNHRQWAVCMVPLVRWSFEVARIHRLAKKKCSRRWVVQKERKHRYSPSGSSCLRFFTRDLCLNFLLTSLPMPHGLRQPPREKYQITAHGVWRKHGCGCIRSRVFNE